MALRITIPFPPELTDRVLRNALESSYGSGYWLNDRTSLVQWKDAALSSGHEYAVLHIGAPLPGIDAEPVKHSRIGAARIARALEIMLTCGNKGHAERAGRVLAGAFAFDAPDADVVLQFAAFGEVIYG